MEDLVTRQDGETDSNQNSNHIPTDFVFNPITILAVDGGNVPRVNLPERYEIIACRRCLKL